MENNSAIEALRAFVTERDWSQFHSEENLAKSISIEAAELLELFQWDSTVTPENVLDELADVLTYCYLLADKLDVHPDDVVLNKLQETKAKYPVSKARGTSTKYDRL